jgi:hypothetical protein
MQNPINRREFIKTGTVAGTGSFFILNSGPGLGNTRTDRPWYRRTVRWGQTNITERDAAGYDIDWWRGHWRKTRVQGIIVNAGGIVAYYPSQYPLHYRPEALGDRDLFGEVTAAAHQEGLVVLARMDSNRTHEAFYEARPEWFALDAEGRPYRAGELYLTCINSPYYDEYIPGVLREIARRSKPEGFTDNSWSGLEHHQICFCENCRRRFKDLTGQALPPRRDYDDPDYRRWLAWNYDRRLEVWDLNNRTAREAGGPDCLWVGMISGNLVYECRRLRDVKRICERAEFILCDDQSRTAGDGFQANGEIGKRLHGVLGWDKLIPESMAMYQRNPTFRKAANPEPEARMWMLAGIAGGIQPWWHHVGAFQEDRRQFQTAERIYRWHESNEQYLVNREPIATAGVIWSQANADYYGREQAEERVTLPYRGFNQALIRARVPYLPLHADHIETQGDRFALLILPNLGVLSDSQAAALRRFAARGGSLIAGGQTSLYRESGERLADFALGDLLGIRSTGRQHGPAQPGGLDHSYLRLLPDAGLDVYGPLPDNEKPDPGERHAVLKGFEATNILPFGGILEEVEAAEGTSVPLTYVPDFPIYPPETSWTGVPRTSLPALVLRETTQGARIAYLAADLDRRFARNNLPDHGDLLANLVRWSLGNELPLRVEGPGLLDCHLYRQPGRLVLHLINLTSAGTWRPPLHELIPVGPLRVSVRLPEGIRAGRMRQLVSRKESRLRPERGWARLEVSSVLDHEVIIIE